MKSPDIEFMMEDWKWEMNFLFVELNEKENIWKNNPKRGRYVDTIWFGEKCFERISANYQEIITQ